MSDAWRRHGLTPQGGDLADEVIRQVVDIVRRVGPDVARAVLDEAVFRVCELPRRTKQFQRKYLEKL